MVEAWDGEGLWGQAAARPCCSWLLLASLVGYACQVTVFLVHFLCGVLWFTLPHLPDSPLQTGIGLTSLGSRDRGCSRDKRVTIRQSDGGEPRTGAELVAKLRACITGSRKRL